MGLTRRPGRVPEPAPLPTLAKVERDQGRAVRIVPPLAGLLYRGRLVGYAWGRDRQRYAVVDTGRELSAFRTDEAEMTAGREVRATGRAAPDDRRRRSHIWRLGDDERERAR